MLVRDNVHLAPLTTLGVGGPARFFAEVQSIEDVRNAVQFARSQDLQLFVLGGGSNLVISDAGFAGLIMKMSIRGIDRKTDGSKTHFDVSAGEVWDDFVARAV